MASNGDVSDESFVESFVDQAAKTFSRIDYSVQCAGILGKSRRSHETATKDFDQITKVNYRGTWLASRAVLTRMIRQTPLSEHPKQRGAIVNIASQLGLVVQPGAGECNNLQKVIHY